MKTAKEIYEKMIENPIQDIDAWCPISFNEFQQAITEHDNEIKDKIDELIKEANDMDRSDPTQDYYHKERDARIKTHILKRLRDSL